MTINFRELFRNFRRVPRMYLLDSGAGDVMAFVAGCDMATGRELLKGCNQWTHARLGGTGRTSIGWEGQIMYATIPEFAGSSRRLRDLTDEENRLLIAALFDNLDAFLAEHPHVYEISGVEQEPRREVD